LRADVADCYCEDNGRPGIDPEAAGRLMLAGFLYGVVHDRRLMRETQVNIAMRWFSGYKLHDALRLQLFDPHPSNAGGDERLRRIFEKSIDLCIQAGLVTGI
jgi:transposase